MKKIIFCLLIISAILALITSCSSAPETPVDTSVVIPAITNVDESTAKTLLASNGLIPAVKYENSDDVTKGCIIKTDPEIGTSVEKNTVVTLYISDGPQLTVPDVNNTDEATAKNILSSNTLIPSIEYQYDDNTQKGYVIKTLPEIGAKVQNNSKITVYISKGPSYIKAKDATIEWKGNDEWEFYTPYIKEDVLYIECKVSFATNLKWKDDYNSGEILGNASINDTYDKTVPVSAKYTKQSWSANEKQDFTLKIPLSDLDVDKPTSMHVRLYAEVNGTSKQFNVSFSMTW